MICQLKKYPPSRRTGIHKIQLYSEVLTQVSKAREKMYCFISKAPLDVQLNNKMLLSLVFKDIFCHFTRNIYISSAKDTWLTGSKILNFLMKWMI